MKPRLLSLLLLFTLTHAYAQEIHELTFYLRDSLERFTGFSHSSTNAKQYAATTVTSERLNMKTAQRLEQNGKDTTFLLDITFGEYNAVAQFKRRGKSKIKTLNGKDTSAIVSFFIDEFITAHHHYLEAYAPNTFEKLNADSVVAYAFESHESQIVENGKLNRTAKQPGVTLSKDEIKEVTDLLYDTATFGNSPAACFEPHLGIVFYKDKKIVGYVSICQMCNSLMATPWLPAEEYHLVSTGFSMMDLYGFSEKGNKKIEELCNRWKLGHCAPHGGN